MLVTRRLYSTMCAHAIILANNNIVNVLLQISVHLTTSMSALQPDMGHPVKYMRCHLNGFAYFLTQNIIHYKL